MDPYGRLLYCLNEDSTDYYKERDAGDGLQLINQTL